MSEVVRKNLGGVTAYAYARSKGYTGTEDEFAQLMANYATVGQAAEEAAEQAIAAEINAESAAQTATTKASEASSSATSASSSASAAATSETNAAASSTAASGSATQAANSASVAQAAQTAAEAVKESIPQDYTTLSNDVYKIPPYKVVQGSWGNSGNQNIVLAGFYKPESKRIMFHTTRPVTASGNYYKIGIVEYNDSPYGNLRKTYSYKVDANLGVTVNKAFNLQSDTIAVAFQIAEYDSNNQQVALSAASFDNYYVWIQDVSYDEFTDDFSYLRGNKISCEIENGTVPNAANPNCIKTVNFISCGGGDIVYITPTRPLPNKQYKYCYGYSFYDANQNEVKRVDISEYAIYSNFVNIPENVAFIRFSIGQVDSSYQFVPIRSTDFTNNNYYVFAYVQGDNYYNKYLERALSNNALPRYWMEYLEEKVSAINLEVSDSVGFKGSSFYFFTDVHWPNNEKNSPAIIRWLQHNTPVGDVIQGGDILNKHNSRLAAFAVLEDYLSRMAEVNPVNLVGNHDDNSNGQSDETTRFVGKGAFYRLLNSRTEPFVSWVAGTNYGYRDLIDQKIRYYFLDTGTPDLAPIDEDQKTWFETSIDSLTSDWSVIVFGHMFFTPRTDEYDSIVMNSNGWYVAGVLSNVISKAEHPHIIAMICGHTHRDFSLVYDGKFPVICTTCDAGMMSVGADPNTEYVAGTITAQAIDIFCVNTVQKTIKAIRIGNGSDRNWTYNN